MASSAVVARSGGARSLEGAHVHWLSARTPWPYPDETGLPAWDERILALMPPSVDETQIVENLKLTPTERTERLQALVDAVAAMRGER